MDLPASAFSGSDHCPWPWARWMEHLSFRPTDFGWMEKTAGHGFLLGIEDHSIRATHLVSYSRCLRPASSLPLHPCPTPGSQPLLSQHDPIQALHPLSLRLSSASFIFLLINTLFIKALDQ